MWDINSSKQTKHWWNIINSTELILWWVHRVASVVWWIVTFPIACITYPLYHYNVSWYQERLKLRVGALLVTLEWRAYLSTGWFIERVSDDFLGRVESARIEVLDKFESLGVDVEVPAIEKKRIFTWYIQPTGGLKSVAGLKIWLWKNYALVFQKRKDVLDSTIRHEVAHIPQNISYPSWIRELWADSIAGIERNESSHAYWINFVWAKVLFWSDSGQVIKNMYNPDKKPEDVMMEIDWYLDVFIKAQKDNYPDECEYLSSRKDYISIFLHWSNPQALSNITHYLMNEKPELWWEILGINMKDIEANMFKFVWKEDTQFDPKFELLKYMWYLFMNAYLTILFKKLQCSE